MWYMKGWKEKVVSPLSELLVEGGPWFAQVQIGKDQWLALVDNGASVNVVSSEFVKVMGCPLLL